MAEVTTSFSGCWKSCPIVHVKPFLVKLNLLAVIGHDDVVHGLDAAAGIDTDCLARGNLYSRNRLCLWTDVVGANLPEGIHQVRIAVQGEDLFLCPANGEFAQGLIASGIGKVQGSEAGLGQTH